MRESRVPMIKHLDGVCHVYIDDDADLEMAVRIADNAKTQRYGVCNTMETLLVAQTIAPAVLPHLGAILDAKGVEMRGCPQTNAILARAGIASKPATEEDWRAEYLAPILAICTVPASTRRSSTSTPTAASTPMPSSRATMQMRCVSCAKLIRHP